MVRFSADGTNFSVLKDVEVVCGTDRVSYWLRNGDEASDGRS